MYVTLSLSDPEGLTLYNHHKVQYDSELLRVWLAEEEGGDDGVRIVVGNLLAFYIITYI